ncbi:MAG: hypothetical protein H6R01_93 [Burkholderiaceae bacterium]|nr:hypothetical protein [Burkholderiaceae bacterium]
MCSYRQWRGRASGKSGNNTGWGIFSWCRNVRANIIFRHIPHIFVENSLIIEMQIPVIFQTAGLLILSNVFMTVAWYGHLRNLSGKAWWVAAIVSWGIALFEYLLQVPANRIGYTHYSLAQLKIMQEVITLSLFVPFAMLYMKEPFKLDYVWAALCLVGAVYFIFRS